MTIKDENTCFRFETEINRITQANEYLSLAHEQLKHQGNKDEVRNLMEIELPRLASAIVNLKSIYASLQTNSYQIVSFNRKVSSQLNVSFEVVDDEIMYYLLTFPTTVSKSKISTAYKQLLTDACIDCINSYSGELERIKNPVIFFEHCFDKYGAKTSIKDVDNYETSAIINMLQLHLISDDRQASTFHTNKYNSSKCETRVYVVPKEHFVDFLQKEQKI